MKEIDGLLSIARKAGYCIIGQDNLLGYKKKLYLLLLDKNAGAVLTRNIKFMANERNIEVCMVENLEQICKIENCKVLGIKNKGLSDEIALRIKGE